MKVIKMLFLCVMFSYTCYAQIDQPTNPSGDTVYINMAALDQPFMYNRLGTAQPTGMIFALENDIVSKNGRRKAPGNVRLRDGKRPRPIVLRANVGDVLVINFTNYLRPYIKNQKVEFYEGHPTSQIKVNPLYPATRDAGVHIVGTDLATSINDDASNVGSNESSLCKPGESKKYTLFAGAEGTFVLHSTGDNIADGTIRAGQISNGLFGSLIVEPPQAEWYRSQVTEQELYDATNHWIKLGPDGSQTKVNKPNNASIQFKQSNKGFPMLDYNATKNGMPILKMYKQLRPNARELIASDLTAMITGPKASHFPSTSKSPSFLPLDSISRERRQPYREFSIHYHEAPYAVQAFPAFYDNSGPAINNLTQTIQGGVDQFAINYGTGGIGAEIYANRAKVGPMHDCVDCAYEEFFLSAWAVGDPAQVVDIPANAASFSRKTTKSTTTEKHVNAVLQELMIREADLLGTLGTSEDTKFIDTEIQATQAYFPDDPSNVYHSYMNDHVKFRINHCGAGITHVHHQHAHQWLHSPNSDDGHYLDSQTINPGASYTLEIVYGGSGNLNKTVGDQIFHCHFYPHFAQGMWAMWRVHDVLETGTVLQNGKIAPGSRALPDGEIAVGTPIPGLVPISTLAMAPVPGKVSIVDGQVELSEKDVSPGYPFFIPGVAGQRPPAPPMDFAKGDVVTVDGEEIKDTELNGGLPRNVVYDGDVLFENHTIYDWTKISGNLHSIKLPEEGTYYEKLAMKMHAIRNHNTLTPLGKAGDYILNGKPPVSGAPYADPAITWDGNSVGTLRRYKAANVQVDAVLNELGWHYPQQRPIVLWGDVASTISGDRPPQPFFFRANSDEYIEYWHTNLVPEYYELDDYQVRTPTDVIGQHIHLVKFDVTSSDGAANGFNYQDGTLAAGMVRHQIDEINKGAFYDPDLGSYFSGSLVNTVNGISPVQKPLVAYKPMEIWGKPPAGQNWDGAQTTIQRWFANPLYNNDKEDRTLRTVFTHDHYGPSTHQQIGLYAGLLIEPKGSTWLNSSTGTKLGFAQLGETRDVKVDGVTKKVSDGGPTNWQAIIQTQDKNKSYREFMFEFQDNQQAYLAGSKAELDPYPEFDPPADISIFQDYVDAFRKDVDDNYTGWLDPVHGINIPGSPELVTTGNRGTLSVNYRNSPVPIRVDSGKSTDPKSTDLAYAFSSNVKRNKSALNSQPTGGARISKKNDFTWPKEPLGPGMEGGDPYTPLARAYAGDRIQVRTLVGSHVNPHFFNIHGVKWYFEPSFENSGFRSTQMMSISEHFEMNFRLPFAKGNSNGVTDYLYKTNADDTGIQAGTFGFMRAYNKRQSDLHRMPSSPTNKSGKKKDNSARGCGCPGGAEIVEFDVSAISIDKYQIGGPNWGILNYNEQHRNFDSKAMIFIKTDEVADFMSTSGYEPKPLVLRAKAGDCIRVKLRNKITPGFVNNTGTITYVKPVKGAKNQPNTTYNYETSYTVGMHAELVSYDVSQNDGASIGQNDGKLLGQGDGFVEYEWYAGQWSPSGGLFKPEPVELGTCVITAPDPLLQYVSGLFGALIVEPEGSFWVEDQNNPTSATVYESEDAYRSNQPPLFREFVMMFQDNVNIGAEPIGEITGVPVVAGLNYKSDPLANRVFFDAQGTVNFNSINVSDIVSNHIVLAAPETPTFVSGANTPLRLRVMYAGGVGDGTTFDLHGHVWQELPYTDSSKKLGFNLESQWMGARGQLGALNAFDLLINSAGGINGVTGDYLYRDYRNQLFQNGIWGVMKVTDGKDAPMVTRIDLGGRGKPTTYRGMNTVDPTTGKYAKKVQLLKGRNVLAEANVNQFNGRWETQSPGFRIVGGLTVTSINADGSKGGSVTYTADQVRQLTTPSQKRVKMPDTRRSPVKKVEPGANKGSFLNLRARDRR